jgi:hypothetical protein
MKNAIIAAAPMQDYQAEDDFHTLSRAEEVKADAKRHAAAIAHGKGKVAAMQAVVEPDADDKKPLPKRGARTATHAKVKAMGPATRVPRVNSSRVI